MTSATDHSAQRQLQSFLQEMAQLKIKIHLAEGGKLAVRAPKGVMTAEIAARIQENKPAIISFFRAADAGLESLVPMQPHGEARPFFCVHGGAGHIFHYRQLAEALGKGRPFYGLQPKMDAQDGTRAAYVEVPEMARHFVNEIITVQPEGPYLVGGFCFGGVIALEIAQQLKQSGREVGMLVGIDPTDMTNLPVVQPPAAAQFQHAEGEQTAASPTIRERLRNKSAGMIVMLAWNWVRRKLRRWWNQQGSLLVEGLRTTFLRFYLRSGKPVPARWHDLYFMNLVTMPARNRYHPQPYDGEIYLFLSQHAGVLEESWQRVSFRPVHVQQVDTDHMGMLERPSVDHIAAAMRSTMERIG